MNRKFEDQVRKFINDLFKYVAGASLLGVYMVFWIYRFEGTLFLHLTVIAFLLVFGFFYWLDGNVNIFKEDDKK